jgi:cyclophilin family peptidyl-prolyl cis-trans isomerase
MPVSQKPRKTRHRTPPKKVTRKKQSPIVRFGITAAISAIALSLGLLTVFSTQRQQQAKENKAAPKEDKVTTTLLDPEGGVPCPRPDGEARRNSFPSSGPPQCLVVGHSYKARLTTDAGAFVIALDPSKAPASVNAFVFLARYHFYDDLTFHRAKPGFFVQTGDPVTPGVTGPGFVFDDQLPKKGEYLAGSVAMAHPAGGKNGSQFLIVTEDAPALQPVYPLFGQVVEGLDIVRKIAADGDDKGNPKGVPHRLLRITVEESA